MVRDVLKKDFIKSYYSTNVLKIKHNNRPFSMSSYSISLKRDSVANADMQNSEVIGGSGEPN